MTGKSDRERGRNESSPSHHDQMGVTDGQTQAQRIFTDSEAELPLSRRKALGSLLAVGGVGAWLGYTQLQNQDTTEEPSPGEESNEESPWVQAKARRGAYHAREFTLIPTFDYEPVDIQLSATDSQVHRFAAKPLEGRMGDRIVAWTEQSVAGSIADTLVAVWPLSRETTDAKTATIDEQEIEFDVYSGEDLALAVAIRDVPARSEMAELLLVRGTDGESLDVGLESFSVFYSTLLE